MNITIGNSWDNILKDEFSKDYFKELDSFINEERKKVTVYPLEENVFYALKMTSFEDVKVVIFGQDPYHEPGQAHGLAFSVRTGTKLPPSLINIYKELNAEYGLKISDSGDLTPWAKQGVLLLNNVLTVRQGEADSHKKKGWENFTDKIVEILNERDKPIVFIFWGNNAKKKRALVTNPNHLVLESAHPSPLSAYHGFFGNNHFRKVNEFLKKNNMEEISWEIPSKNICLF